MASNPLGGDIGYNIYVEQEPKNNSMQFLGQIGNPIDLDDAAAAEVRGTTHVSLTDFSVDVDRYQGTASWWREPFDQTGIGSAIGFSVPVGVDQAAGFVAVVWDAYGNVIFSGFDFIMGSGLRSILGDENYNQFEASDTDFVNGGSGIHWNFPQIAGFYGNTFAVAVDGFLLDFSNPDALSLPLHYTMDWAFGAPNSGGISVNSFISLADAPAFGDGIQPSFDFSFPPLTIPDFSDFLPESVANGGPIVSLQQAQNIALLYEAGLDRVAEDGGLNFWIGRFANGEHYETIASEFLGSQEFYDNHGDYHALSDHDYLELLYNNILDRDGEQAGMDYWTDQLEGGRSREDVLSNFAQSTENVAQSTYLHTLTTDPSGYWYFA